MTNLEVAQNAVKQAQAALAYCRDAGQPTRFALIQLEVAKRMLSAARLELM